MDTTLKNYFTEDELHHLRRAFSDYADEKIRSAKERSSSPALLHAMSDEFSIIAQKLRQLLADKTEAKSQVTCA